MGIQRWVYFDSVFDIVFLWVSKEEILCLHIAGNLLPAKEVDWIHVKVFDHYRLVIILVFLYLLRKCPLLRCQSIPGYGGSTCCRSWNEDGHRDSAIRAVFSLLLGFFESLVHLHMLAGLQLSKRLPILAHLSARRIKLSAEHTHSTHAKHSQKREERDCTVHI